MNTQELNPSDPIALAQALIRCPSVTPLDEGALDLLQNILAANGFICTRYPFGEVDNLYARLGTDAPNFCYAGHTDVVPIGNEDEWTDPPFAALIKDGQLWGRGAADMKGGVAAFVSAVVQNLASGWTPNGSISFLITGDEEGPAINGTVKVLEAITAAGEKIDHCLVGEPTNPDTLGEMVKIGRRGSLNGVMSVEGIQGHVAYPHRAQNPVPILMDVLQALRARELDNGNDNFQPSNLEVTSIDVNNTAHNVIAARAVAKFNIRFNNEHNGDELKQWILQCVQTVQENTDAKIHADLKVTGESFLTTPCGFSDHLSAAIADITGKTPELSTSGGTSDARFITNYAPVIEFGLIGKTIHQVDEHASVEDIKNLCSIYKSLLKRYFK